MVMKVLKFEPFSLLQSKIRLYVSIELPEDCKVSLCQMLYPLSFLFLYDNLLDSVIPINLYVDVHMVHCTNIRYTY